MNTAIPRDMARGVDRALAALSVLAIHEAGIVAGHWDDLRIRYRVARRARSLGELLVDQIDLLPDSRQRLRHDREQRRELLQVAAEALRRPAG